MIKRILMMVLLVLCSFGEALGATFYVCGSSSSCGTEWVTGSDSNQCTAKSSPCGTIAGGIGKMSGGDTLVVGSGIYSGQSVSVSKSGSASAYTVVRAEVNGGVTLSGGGISFSGSYIIIDGFTALNGRGSFGGSNNILRNTGIGNSTDGSGYGNNIVSMSGSNNLMEDCWLWGAGRAGVEDHSSGNTYRRVVVRKDYHALDSEDTAFLLYEASNILVENCIALDYNAATVGGAQNDWRVGMRSRSGSNHRFFGCISLNLPRPSYTGYHGFRLGAASAENCIAWDVGAYGFYAGNGTPYIRYCTAGDTGSSPITGGSGSNTLINPSGSTLPYLPRPSGADGAHIEYRYQNGQLTNVPLWPWPNEDRIKRDFQTTLSSIPSSHQNPKRGFAASGNGLYGGAITLTSYIWEYLGSALPAEIYNTKNPLRPSNLRVGLN